jgi:glycosyltransferase involved in cell wall biosynthesis
MLSRMPQATAWHERPPGSALVYMKNPSKEHRVLMADTIAKLKRLAPHIDLSQVLEGRHLSHQEFLQRLGSVRYFINMSLAEGFGLVPLEAMAMGTMVTGVDGLAGRDYLRHGENCLISSIKNLRNLPQVITQAFDDEKLAAQCAAGGQETARLYGYPPFKAAWLKQFTQFLQKEPRNAA